MRKRINESLTETYAGAGFDQDSQYAFFSKRVDNGLLVVFDRLTEARLEWDFVKARLEAEVVVGELRRTGLPLPYYLTTVQSAIASPRPRRFRRPVILSHLDLYDPEGSAIQHARNALMLTMRWWATVTTVDRILAVMRDSYQLQLEQPGAQDPNLACSWAIVEHLCGHTDKARAQFSAWNDNYWFPDDLEPQRWAAQVERILTTAQLHR